MRHSNGAAVDWGSVRSRLSGAGEGVVKIAFWALPVA
jgi:hypothetical protein